MPRSYTITPYDVSVEELAQRFHIGDPKAILKINPTLFPTGADSGQFTAGMHGLAIFLPDATKSNLDWTPYTASAGETLAHVCKKMNKDRRIDPSRKGRDIPTPPWLTPQYLLDAYENADLRAGHGADASKVKLAPGEMVNVSFPQRLAGARHIAATPKGTTTFHVPPDWVIELTNAYESIRARTRAFEPSVNALRETRRSAAVEVSALNAWNSILQLTIDHPAHAPQLHTSEITSLRKMSRALATLHDTAAASMVDNVFLYVDNRAQLDATLDAGRKILADLRAARFGELSKRLAGVAAKYPRTVTNLCDALSFAYQTLADSPLSEESQPDMAAAAKYVAGLRPVDGSKFAKTEPRLADAIGNLPQGVAPPDTALGAMVSLLGVTTASVGNEAGPSSLAVAVLRVMAANNAKNQLKEMIHGYEATAAILGDTAEIVGFSVNAFAKTSDQVEEILTVAVSVRNGVATATESAFLKDLDEHVAGRAMTSPGWVAGLGLLNLLAVGLAGYQIRQSGLTWSSGLAAASAGMGTVAGVAYWPVVSKVIGMRVLTWIGTGAIVVGAAASIYQAQQAYDQGDTVMVVLNGISVVGSGLLLASLALGPVVAVAGGILIVTSGVISIAVALSRGGLFQSAPEAWWLAQEAAFEAGPMFKQVAAKYPDLSAKAQAFKSAIQDADFLEIDVMRRAELRLLVRSDDDVRALMPAGML